MISYEAAGSNAAAAGLTFRSAAGLNPCRLLALGFVNLIHFWIYPIKNKKGPTYGPNSDEEWSQTIIHQ